MANRKLQAEIDRTLKKVGEGIIEFDGIFQKIASAPSQNQKEKHENDLKREIKKLQRLREQIKTWIGQNDVKNKQPLVEARQRIEKEMERYKAYERESKTKEFSNEGLRLKMKQARQGNTKRAQFIEFLEETLSNLGEECAKLEKSIKALEAKETDDPDELEEDALKIAELDEKIDRHKAHIDNIEKLVIKFKAKKLSNESVAPVQENMEKYLSGDSEESTDEVHDTLISLYEGLDLDNLSGENADDAEDETAGEGGEEDGDDEEGDDEDIEDDDDENDAKVAKDKELKDQSEKDQEQKEREAKAAQVVVAVRAQPTPSAGSSPTPPASPQKTTQHHKASEAKQGSDSKSSPLPPSQRAAARKDEKEVVQPQPVKSNKKSKGTPLPLGPQPGEETDFPRLGSSQPVTPPPVNVPVEDPSLAAASGLFAGPTPSTSKATSVLPSSSPPASGLSRSQHVPPPSAASAQMQNPTVGTSQPAIPTPAQRAALAQSQSLSPPVTPSPTPSPASSQSLVSSAVPTTPSPQSISPSASGYVPPGPTFDQMLMRSWRCLPDTTSALGQPAAVSPSGESMLPLVEYTPKNPVQVHSSFPQSMAPNFDDASMFEKFDTDTLFFIFYYQQGTYQQYLAAKELKRQSWRYHKKYLTWFQRHEEPKEITPEYEQGTYVYFDYETGWCQRKKTEFTFEYRYLEDT